MEKVFRDFIKRAWTERLKRERQFKKIKSPIEYSGELSGSQFYQWRKGEKAVTLALVFSQGRRAIGMRLYWQSDGSHEIDVVGSKNVDLIIDQSPSLEDLIKWLKQSARSVMNGDQLLHATPDPWYLAPFPPRERIEPLMNLPAVIEEMQVVQPSALNGGWQGNGAWDNWATVNIYGGPLTLEDAAHACVKPVESMLLVLDRYFLPISYRLMAD